ncbi:helix-turn-helix domain-containing protein [Chitinophaga nivalis]|uniref:Helix-turn-helix domain-containing protein n=1 Tax=Chitinophaga nivalis TaxID=2991709 RepID=A0ABT3IKB9_9BACT|nr:helix-turn-helix domain-containing protein [Chitinophaga nivalis]MCW3465898.1 helix-turn-helix domain-containing protein [Chitinophaga nivalis]MCW3484411.1 helix-turn-helix domain-containing protein [Chitinophaga nivalis]
MKMTADTSIPVYTETGEPATPMPDDVYVACFEQANIRQLSPHRRTFYQVIFFREGYGTQWVDFQEYTFNGPTLILLSPNQVHQMDINTDARGHILMLPERFFALDSGPESAFVLKDVFDNTDRIPFLQFGHAAATALDASIRQIQRSFQADGSMRKLILLSYVKIFLLQAYQLRETLSTISETGSHTGRQQFRQFKILIEQHYRTLHLPHDYAAQLHISLKQLNLLTRKYAFSSAGDLIKQRILLEAQRYLYHGVLTVKEISHQLGFEDPAYFNRFFKREMKIPPYQFRKMAGNNQRIAIAGKGLL